MTSNAYYFGQPIVQTQVNSSGGGFQNINSSVTVTPQYNVYQGIPQQQVLSFPVFKQAQTAQSYYPQASFNGNLYNYGNNAVLNNFTSPSAFYPPVQPIVYPPMPQNNSSDDLMLMMILISLLQTQANGNVQTFPSPPPPAGFMPPPDPFCPIHCPSNAEPVTMQPTSQNAKVHGDPHFVGFEGEKYDVMGKSGHVYNLMSDKNLQFNALFTGNNDVTYVGTAGIKVGTTQSGISQFKFSHGGKVPEFNGKKLAKNEKVTFDTGLFDENNRPIQGYAIWEGKKFTINTGEYEIRLVDKGSHLDQDVSVTRLGVLSDGVYTHGLLGQTADFDGKVRNGKKGKGAQGEGAIEGVYTDYEVKNLFEDNFKFNHFGSKEQTGRKFGFGADKTANAA